MGIIRQLNRLGKEVNRKYPAINYGGCCVYAALVAEALLLHKISAKGIVASSEAKWFNTGHSIDDVREYVRYNTINRWNGCGVMFSHVGLEFEVRGKLRHYDSMGVTCANSQLDGMTIYKGRLQIHELQKLAGKRDGWNTSFNRRHIPGIRKLVREYLSVDKIAQR